MSALALADGRYDVNHACGKILPRRIVDLHAETLVGKLRCEIVEIDLGGAERNPSIAPQ